MAYKRRFAAKKYNRANAAARKRKPAVKSTRRMQALIRRTVLRVAEPKFTMVTVDKSELFHNQMNYCLHLNNAASMPAQGSKDTERIGDQLHSTHFKLRALFGQKSDRPNVNFRWFVLEVPKGVTPTYSNMFNLVTGNILLDDPNKDVVKVLQSGQMRPNEAGLTSFGDNEYTFAKRWTIPYKRTYKFGPADAAKTHNQKELYLIIMAYDAYGTLVTDNIAYVQTIKEFFYKDP